ncbi:unnamed protein product [marine sediment metagenome]|uniref:Uncharacterized protein n=1 Tax=marine sediment metagenome TaxID=412755 RepID=X1QID2_9ZZZZ
MRVDVASCGLCGAAHAGSELNPKWYAEGLRHTKRGDIVKRLICPECVSGIIDGAGEALRKRAPDSVVIAAAIELMDEDGLLVGHKPIDMAF